MNKASEDGSRTLGHRSWQDILMMKLSLWLGNLDVASKDYWNVHRGWICNERAVCCILIGHRTIMKLCCSIPLAIQIDTRS